LVNYAFAGARSGTDNLMPVYGMQQGMLKQIQDFLDNQPSTSAPVDANALYVLWTGPDDYYADGNIFNKLTTYQIANNVNQGMVKLYKRGARHFFVPQMPDLSITPSAHEHNKTLTNYLVNAKARSAEFATVLTSTLKAFAKQYPQADVHTFGTYTYSQMRMVQAAAEGNNVTESCYTPVFPGVPGPVCAEPDKYLFWDANHPTAAGSTVIGTDFAKSVVSDAPLPSR
jgi:phospholipase/lecithinase/hemolysin